MQTLSSDPSFCASPMKNPLFRMLWWVSVAPLGAPVVPLVNWMLIGSSNWSVPPSSSCRNRARPPPLAEPAPRRPRADLADLGKLQGPGTPPADLDHRLQLRQAGA